jgi:hypothetical protein
MMLVRDEPSPALSAQTHREPSCGIPFSLAEAERATAKIKRVLQGVPSMASGSGADGLRA